MKQDGTEDEEPHQMATVPNSNYLKEMRRSRVKGFTQTSYKRLVQRMRNTLATELTFMAKGLHLGRQNVLLNNKSNDMLKRV